MKSILRIALWTLTSFSAVCAYGQVNSVSVKVDNSNPPDVIFGFQTGPNDNVDQIQINCTSGNVYVYEVQPNGFITTYSFGGAATGDCDIVYHNLGQTNATMTGTLINPITVNTSDHVVTISNSTAWSAALKPVYHGYAWRATGGEATITVGTLSSKPFYPCGSKKEDCFQKGR